LFAFALGLVAGANAVKLRADPNKPEFEELPEGYSLAGSKLDALAGDAFLRSNSHWFLLEMKREYSGLKSELAKPRIIVFKASLRKYEPPAQWPPLLETAKTAHQFLYLVKRRGRPTPELATLSYLRWLHKHTETTTPTYWKSLSQSFTSFLFKAGGEGVVGFTAEELVEYVALLNEARTGQEALTKEEAAERIAIGINAAGMATMVTYNQFLIALDLERQATPKATDTSGDNAPARFRP
jgi:hypothetical protein